MTTIKFKTVDNIRISQWLSIMEATHGNLFKQHSGSFLTRVADFLQSSSDDTIMIVNTVRLTYFENPL